MESHISSGIKFILQWNHISLVVLKSFYSAEWNHMSLVVLKSFYSAEWNHISLVVLKSFTMESHISSGIKGFE